MHAVLDGDRDVGLICANVDMMIGERALPVRNLWSLQPGECIVAEELSQRGLSVYFPVHDTGVDLLVVKGANHIGIQVKESRYYSERKRKSGHTGHSWHQIHEKKLRRSKADFYVFLTYLPRYDAHKVGSFRNLFLIVPKRDLTERITAKDPGKRRIYSFYFHFEDGRVWDERVTVPLTNKLTDYSDYLDNWRCLKQALVAAETKDRSPSSSSPTPGFQSVEAALTSLGYQKKSRSKWARGTRIVHITRSSEWGPRQVRISWREKWKTYHALIYDYSRAGGPICIVPAAELFAAPFVSKKRREQAYVNSGHWWSQVFPIDHKLAQLVIKAKDQWSALE
jgi:hypothetical protein